MRVARVAVCVSNQKQRHAFGVARPVIADKCLGQVSGKLVIQPGVFIVAVALRFCPYAALFPLQIISEKFGDDAVGPVRFQIAEAAQLRKTGDFLHDIGITGQHARHFHAKALKGCDIHKQVARRFFHGEKYAGIQPSVYIRRRVVVQALADRLAPGDP